MTTLRKAASTFVARNEPGGYSKPMINVNAMHNHRKKPSPNGRTNVSSLTYDTITENELKYKITKLQLYEQINYDIEF